jgi:hypothetical protein
MKVKASYEDILELLNKRGVKVDFEKKEISLNRNVVYLQSYSNLVRLLYLLDDLLNQSK